MRESSKFSRKYFDKKKICLSNFWNIARELQQSIGSTRKKKKLRGGLSQYKHIVLRQDGTFILASQVLEDILDK